MAGKTVKGFKFSMVRTWIAVVWIMTPKFLNNLQPPSSV